MRRIGLVAGLALGLAGCGGGGYEWGGAQGGGRGLPEVPMRASQAVVVPPGRDAQEALALRASFPDPRAGRRPAGARCRVTGGDYFRADVVAPVRLVLPDLGPDAPVLRADCAAGTARGAAAVAPFYPWPPEGRPSPPQRIWWGGGWWYGFQKTGPCAIPTSRSACAETRLAGAARGAMICGGGVPADVRQQDGHKGHDGDDDSSATTATTDLRPPRLGSTVGLGGDDILDGGRGNDCSKATAARLALGGRGQDFLDGGRGADAFWFDTRDSYDVINDFGGGDAVIIDVEDGGFEGVDRGDLLSTGEAGSTGCMLTATTWAKSMATF